MGKQQGILRRGSRYFSHFRVPKDLREVIGKEFIREALGTSDFREACRLVAYERMRWQAVFDEERRKMKAKEGPMEGTERVLLSITERQAHELAARYLIRLERKFRDWWEKKGLQTDADERHAAVVSVATEVEIFTGGSEHHAPDDGSSSLRSYLETEGIKCPPTSPAFEVLRPLFRAVEAEHSARKLDVLEGRPLVARDSHFQSVFAHSELPEEKPGTTVAELVKRFTKALRDAERSEATLRTYEMPFRVLREGLGESFLLSGINQERMESLCDLLRKLPVNSMQRYPSLALPQAIEAADKARDARRLSKRTQRNYFNVIVGIFNFAVEKKLMGEHPAKDRWMKQSFGKHESKPKTQFTIEELNRLFRAPLYTGCIDDERGYAKPGKNRPKRGRFWVPLLSLFHGLRSNESCQLHVADVKERDGIPFLSIVVAAEDGEKSDKKLKTARSQREVPLHPELVKLGFLDFVVERRKANDSRRLFPELPSGAKGYYSDVFSKYFPRFASSALGYKSKACFHSLRHAFRDATRAARLSPETVAILGGWQGGEGNPALVMNNYGKGREFFRLLAQDIAKVKFPGLDLSHLHTRKTAEKAPEKKRLSRVIRKR